MKKVHIKSSLGVGWAKFMERPWYLFGLSVAVAGLFIMAGANGPVVAALAYILYCGYLSVMFKHYHGGHVVFDDLFSMDQRWIYFAFLALIKAVLIFLGLLCFIIPGVYLAIRWMFAEFYVIDKGLRPVEALQASSNLTRGNMWWLFLFMLLAILLVTLGGVVFLVGAIAASTILLFALINIYYSLQN